MGFIDTLFFKTTDGIHFRNLIPFGNLSIGHLDLTTLFLDGQAFHLLSIECNPSVFGAGVDMLYRIHMVLFADDSLRLNLIFGTSFTGQSLNLITDFRGNLSPGTFRDFLFYFIGKGIEFPVGRVIFRMDAIFRKVVLDSLFGCLLLPFLLGFVGMCCGGRTCSQGLRDTGVIRVKS